MKVFSALLCGVYLTLHLNSHKICVVPEFESNIWMIHTMDLLLHVIV